MNTHCISIATLLSLAALASPAAGQCTGEVSIVIQGTHNPFLAGQPAGTLSKQDTAPTASPFLVPLAISGGDKLRFLNVSGAVSNGPGGGGPGPDGAPTSNFDSAADLGISGLLNMPQNCLLGVFLTDQVNSGAAPQTLNYLLSFAKENIEVSPKLFQTFFIGDGLTGGGGIQRFVVPAGATRLFLGSSDGYGWTNNSGTFQLTVTGGSDTLGSCTDSVSLANGGTQSLELAAGAAYAGMPYLMLGSLSGTSPGTPVDSGVLPLNVDAHFLYTLQFANSPPLSNSFGALDVDGKASATFTLPAGLSPNLTGTTFHHAYVVIEVSPTLIQVAHASNAVPVTLLP